MQNKIALLIWLGVVASAAHPVAVAVFRPLSTLWGGPVLDSSSGGFSVLLLLATLVGYKAVPSRLRSFGDAGARNAIVTAAVWTLSGVSIWVVARFLVGSLGELNLAFVCTVAAVQMVLFLTGVGVGIGGLPALAGLMATLLALAAAAGAPPFAGLAPGMTNLPSDQAFPGWGIFLTFIAATALGSILLSVRFRREITLRRAVVVTLIWAVVIHLVWAWGLFLAGRVPSLPRGLPLLTGMAMVFAGVVLPLVYAARKGFGPLLFSPALASNPAAWPELFPGTRSRSRRAWIISYTGVSNEPRVLRQCQALLDDGWEVVVCGYDGHSPRPPDWSFIRLPTTEPFRASVHTIIKVLRGLSRFLVVYGSAQFGWAARVVHELTPLWLHTRVSLLRLARDNPELKPDLVISHDYHTADVGAAIARHYGAKFSIDVHEYAPGQYFNDPHWVKWERPVAAAVNRYYLLRADVITVVSEGIGNLLSSECSLKSQPIVIRSVPFNNVQNFRPAGDRISVLYHGDMSRRREIHTAIASVRFWRDDIDLLLRGSGDPAYMGELHRLVQKYNLEKRVRFEPPVPFDNIVPAANRADIGFFSFTGNSPQIRFTLPNKLFEYVMAGLALCISNQEEVSRIIHRYRNGRLITHHSPEGIAETINGFTRDEIEACKRASIKAAAELNWEIERARLIAAYDSLWPDRSPSRAEPVYESATVGRPGARAA